MKYKDLKALWEEHGFRPNKRLGQNFLIDKNVRDNIIRNIPINSGDTVVEIGPGFGVMSFPIGDICGKLYVIEKDKKICSIMKPLFGETGNIELIEGDVLEQKFCDLAGEEGKIIVCGNIPYNITTPIIQNIVESRHCVREAFLVMQEEYAVRLTSAPGSKDYGSITCYAQFYAGIKKILTIGKNSFYPRPKVSSCLLRMEILSSPAVEVKDEELMFRIIRKAFSERRKKVFNPLSRGSFLGRDKEAWQGILDRCGIDPSLRAEDLGLPEYAAISDAVCGASPPG